MNTCQAAGPFLICRRHRTTLGVCCIAAVIVILMTGSQGAVAADEGCDFWIAPPPDGEDANSGTRKAPWSTLEHASEVVPDDGATVCLEPGRYRGPHSLQRRFATPTTFRSARPYQAVLEHDSTVLDVNGGRNLVLEGFEIRHAGRNAEDYVVNVDQRNKTGDWAQHITLRDNIIHDSYGSDLLKIHNGVRFATVEGNVFYNQGDAEQHLDINSVTDVVVQDNIFFNDMAASGRKNTRLAKHFIVIKDSNGDEDDLLGSRRIRVRRNVFLNWQGAVEALVKVGNDGKPYHEAENVVVENNLLLGNSPELAYTAFGVSGAKDVQFVNNTVVGDLPSKAYAYSLQRKDSNPPSEDIIFANNIWSDPTGTMGAEGSGVAARFSQSNPLDTVRLVHDHNLYWNADDPIPPGQQITPHVDDPFRIVADPLLVTDPSDVTPPHWTGDGFGTGNATIREEFLRLVWTYGAIRPDSPALDAAEPSLAPTEDILRRQRINPDVGAFEAGEVLAAEQPPPVDTGAPLLTLLGVPAVLLVMLPGLLAGHQRPLRPPHDEMRRRRTGLWS